MRILMPVCGYTARFRWKRAFPTFPFSSERRGRKYNELKPKETQPVNEIIPTFAADWFRNEIYVRPSTTRELIDTEDRLLTVGTLTIDSEV